MTLENDLRELRRTWGMSPKFDMQHHWLDAGTYYPGVCITGLH